MPAPSRSLAGHRHRHHRCRWRHRWRHGRLAVEAGARVVAGDLRHERLRTAPEELGADRVALASGDVRRGGHRRGPRRRRRRGLRPGRQRGRQRRRRLLRRAARLSPRAGRAHDRRQRHGHRLAGPRSGPPVPAPRATVATSSSSARWRACSSAAGRRRSTRRPRAPRSTSATRLDRELREEGIRTSVIAPAGVNTAFAAADGRFGDGDPSSGPFMEPGDIAGAVLTPSSSRAGCGPSCGPCGACRRSTEPSAPAPRAWESPGSTGPSGAPTSGARAAAQRAAVSARLPPVE